MSAARRTIILHYHMFKNAGTSVDDILRRNFSRGWITREFPTLNSGNSDLVHSWIVDNPEAVAFSSHTMRGPLPVVPGVDIIPVLFLRDPLARIRSAYNFERDQQVETFGSRLARAHDFQGYCEARLAIPNDRQCRDFHVSILAAMSPGPQDELERARQTVAQLRAAGVVGLVEAFDQSMARLAERIRPVWPGFRWDSTRSNASARREAPTLSPDFETGLREANAMDLALLDWARQPEA